MSSGFGAAGAASMPVKMAKEDISAQPEFRGRSRLLGMIINDLEVFKRDELFEIAIRVQEVGGIDVDQSLDLPDEQLREAIKAGAWGLYDNDLTGALERITEIVDVLHAAGAATAFSKTRTQPVASR